MEYGGGVTPVIVPVMMVAGALVTTFTDADTFCFVSRYLRM
jgi:hypothetical protein